MFYILSTSFSVLIMRIFVPECIANIVLACCLYELRSQFFNLRCKVFL